MTLKFVLLNADGRELQTFSSLQDLITDLLMRAPFLENGDQIIVHDIERDRLLDEIIFQSKRH
jgi:hypothetical protein